MFEVKTDEPQICKKVNQLYGIEGYALDFYPDPEIRSVDNFTLFESGCGRS